MPWQFELVAGPFEGPTGGVVWDHAARRCAVQRRGRRPPAPLRPCRRHGQRVSPLRQPGEWPRLRAERRALRRAGRRAAAGRVHRRRAHRGGRCAARRQVSQPAERSGGGPARPYLFHRSAPSRHSVRPADFSVPRSLFGAPPRTQRSPRLGCDAGSPTTPSVRARCCSRRTKRRSTSPTANPATDSGGSCAPIRSAPTERSTTRSSCRRSAPTTAAHIAASKACAWTPTATWWRLAARSARTGAAGDRVCAGRRGDRKSSVPGRPAEQMLFRRPAP